MPYRLPEWICTVCLLAVLIACNRDDSSEPPLFAAWTTEERQYLIDELERSQNAVLQETADLTLVQWHYRESPDRWSVAEIVEHLQLQDLMFWRELYVIIQFPDMQAYHHLTKAPDSVFQSYAKVTNANRSDAPWYIRPRGRWDNKADALEIYQETRDQIRQLVASSEVDFRRYITPRGWRDQAELRDLHQLVLLLVAHTDRHLGQIRRVKYSYPDEG